MGMFSTPRAWDAVPQATHVSVTDSATVLKMASPTPFRINIPQTALDDLKTRLQNTRLPDHIPETGWDMGTEPTYLQVGAACACMLAPAR